jgi:hypothetical protein
MRCWKENPPPDVGGYAGGRLIELMPRWRFPTGHRPDQVLAAARGMERKAAGKRVILNGGDHGYHRRHRFASESLQTGRALHRWARQ